MKIDGRLGEDQQEWDKRVQWGVEYDQDIVTIYMYKNIIMKYSILYIYICY